MKYPNLLSQLAAAFTAMLLLLLSACSADYCGELVFNEAMDTCECPPGTEPDYDLDACVGDGVVIPWGDVRIPPRDAGFDGPMDAGPIDAGPMDTDLDSSDVGHDAGGDAGPPPADLLAHFPSNGFTTGSIHTRDAEPLVNHPLRPKFMWDTAAGAEHYQIQLTRECTLSDFRTCPFERIDLDETTPETTFWPSESLPVARTRPVGSRYFWRVRACSMGDVCSAWTEIRYLDVGRDSHDFNGDGYADVVVGADRQSLPETAQGVVYIFLGAGAGPATSPDITLENPSNQARSRFGKSAEAVGDVNGDGYADLLVGSHFYDAPEDNEGAVFLYFGNATGLSATPDLTFDNPLDQANGWFGFRCAAAGDLNGDGYADIAVGAPGQAFPESKEGVVYAYFGGEAGPETEPSLVFDNPDDARNSLFGVFLDAADYDGDGFSDLAVGSIGAKVDIFRGGTSILETAPTRLPLPEMVASSSAFMGQAGDINGDGYADLAFGSPFEARPEDEEGTVYVFIGGQSGLETPAVANIEHPTHQSGALFGQAPTIIDTNGSGRGELVVGANRHSEPQPGEGGVFIFSWDDSPALTVQRFLDNPEDSTNGGFGTTIAAADYNGDGYLDVIVGAPNQNNEGAAFIFFGSPTGIPATPGLTFHNPEAQRGQFGVGVQ